MLPSSLVPEPERKVEEQQQQQPSEQLQQPEPQFAVKMPTTPVLRVKPDMPVTPLRCIMKVEPSTPKGSPIKGLEFSPSQVCRNTLLFLCYLQSSLLVMKGFIENLQNAKIDNYMEISHDYIHAFNMHYPVNRVQY